MGKSHASYFLLKMVYNKSILHACQEKLGNLVSIGRMLGSSIEHVGTMFQAVSACFVVNVSSFVGEVCKLIRSAD